MARAKYLLTSGARVVVLEEGSYVIGRGSEADILFDRDVTLSRRHARLVVGDDGVDVEDLGSTNGTWVNSYLVQHRLRVTEAARLRIGDLELSLAPVSDRPASASRTTQPDRKPPETPESQRDVPTQQTAAFSYARDALNDLIASGNVEQARRTLDPLLAQVELGPTTPEPDAINVATELALRVALAAQAASYVDTAVRIHCAHGAFVSNANLELLATCVAAGLEPDARNVETYLESLDESHKQRFTVALRAPVVTVPAPAPDSVKG
jgi:FHA domain